MCHPQTDGQTEVVNQTLSSLLRASIGENLKNWVECLPLVEFAYNHATHSSSKFSPFEVVYGFNPRTPLEFTPLPLPKADQVSLEGIAKAEQVKKIHEKVKENLNKRNEQIKRQRDKGRKKVEFAPGEWVWLHMRFERFPNKRSTKLAPRGDGPFKIIEKINDNAYRLELLGEFQVSTTFNVSDLSPFDVGDSDMTGELFQEGKNDADIQMEPAQSVEIPPLRGAPMTRSRTKSLKGFTKAVDLFLDKDHSDADRAHADISKDNADPRAFPFTTNDREASTSDVGAETSHEIPQNASYSHTTEWPLMRTKKETSLFVLSLA